MCEVEIENGMWIKIENILIIKYIGESEGEIY